MKNLLLSFLFLYSSFAFADGEAPFSIELESMNIPGAPGIHSYVYAKHNNKWWYSLLCLC